MAAFQTSGEIAQTWGVAAGYGVTGSPSPSYFDPLAVDSANVKNPSNTAWYGWAMLGLAAIAAFAALKGRK